MRQFSSLPEPQRMGLEWKAYDDKRRNLERIVAREREARSKAAELERTIAEESRADVANLARAILAGEADPAADTAALEEWGKELRETRRQKEAADQALPAAEEELRQTIFAHKDEWASQADAVLMEAIEAEREAYEQAQRIAQEARAKRLFAETLSNWVRTITPSFSPPAEAAVPTAVARWQEDASRCERQVVERQRNELLEREALAQGTEDVEVLG